MVSVHHNGTIRTRIVLFVWVRICSVTAWYNGTIRTKLIRKIPRIIVPGICFVRVIVKDFDFVFVNHNFPHQSLNHLFRLF